MFTYKSKVIPIVIQQLSYSVIEPLLLLLTCSDSPNLFAHLQINPLKH